MFGLDCGPSKPAAVCYLQYAVWQIGLQAFAIERFVRTLSHSGPTLKQLISLTGAASTGEDEPISRLQTTGLDKQGLWQEPRCSSFPSTSWWKVGGNREWMCLSHLSTAAVEVFLSKVLKPNCFSAQRPSAESYTVSEPWSLSMPASAAVWM